MTEIARRAAGIALAASIVLVAAAGCTVIERSPTPAASPATPCPVIEESGPLASDRLVDIRIESDASADRVVFVLGARSNAPTEPRGRLKPLNPPFFDGASGIELKIDGGSFVEIRLTGMLLVDEAGVPAYDGPGEFEPGLSVLKALVNVDQFEGHSAWVAGYVGPGCVSLDAPGPGSFVVSFAH